MQILKSTMVIIFLFGAFYYRFKSIQGKSRTKSIIASFGLINRWKMSITLMEQFPKETEQIINSNKSIIGITNIIFMSIGVILSCFYGIIVYDDPTTLFYGMGLSVVTCLLGLILNKRDFEYRNNIIKLNMPTASINEQSLKSYRNLIESNYDIRKN